MTQIPLDIERVVRDVLAELKRAPTSGVSTSSEPTKNASMPVQSNNGELVLSTRLITMDEIDGRLAGIRQVVVGPQAVVTPAVRDALRQRNIKLSRTSTTAKAAAAPLRLVVVAAGTKTDPKILAGALQEAGVQVECHSTKCLLEATDRLAGELIKNDTLGLLLTPHTAAAMCLANRLSGVRAVLGHNTGNLTADLAAVGANLLIVDPQSMGMFKLTQLAGEFCRGGVRCCPEVFRKRLM